MEKIELVNALKTALNDETVAREVIGAAVKTIINGKEAAATTESGWLSLLFNPTTNDMKLRSDVNMAAVAAEVFYGIGCTTIASGTDLNTVTTPGVYRTGSSTSTEGLSNCPATGEAVRVVVTAFGGPTYLRQEVYLRTGVATKSTSHFVRYLNGTTWSAWYKVVTQLVS